MRQHCATSHERRQEPGLSGRSGGAESGRRAASPCSSAPVQVPQQRRGTGPSDSEKEGLAGQGLWLLSERVANIAGYRNSGHDSEGESEVASQGRYRGPSAFHCRAIRRRCITMRVIVVHSCAPTQTVLKLRNKTVGPVLPADVEQSAYVRVAQAGDGARFELEAALEFGV